MEIINRNTIETQTYKKPAFWADSLLSIGGKNKKLISLTRTFEGLVKQSAKDRGNDCQNNEKYIGEIHNFFELFFWFRAEHSNNGNPEDTRQNESNNYALCDLFPNHTIASVLLGGSEKYKAAYKNPIVSAKPRTEKSSLTINGAIAGTTWFATTPRNSPLATSLQKSAKVEDWSFDRLNMLQDYHNQALTSCQ